MRSSRSSLVARAARFSRSLSRLVPADEGFFAGDVLLLLLVLDELAALLLFLEGAVLGEVAGERAELAVVDFEDAGCHLVQEVAVVGDDHEAAGEVAEKVFKPVETAKVEVVGGLVED